MTHLPIVTLHERVAHLAATTTLFIGAGSPRERNKRLATYIRREGKLFDELPTLAEQEEWIKDKHLERFRVRETDSTEAILDKARIEARRRKLNPPSLHRVSWQAEEPSTDDDNDATDSADHGNCHDKKLAGHERTRQYYIHVEEQLDLDDPDDWVIASVYYSVQATTFTGYLSLWRCMTAQGLEINYQNLPKVTFQHLQEGKVKSRGTYLQMKSAVRLYLLAHSTLEKDASERASASAEGAVRLAQTSMQRPVRGAIDNDMLSQLLKLPDAIIPAKAKDNFILLQATGMRGNQLARTELACITLDETEGIMIVCPANHKGRGSRHARPNWEVHTTRPEWAAEVIRIVKTRRVRGDTLLATGWDPVQANAYIKIAADKLRWDRKLVWVVHSLRHGAVMTCFAAEEGDLMQQLLKAQTMSTHVSPSMILAYAKSNTARGLLNNGVQAVKAQMRNAGHSESAIATALGNLGKGAAGKAATVAARLALVKQRDENAKKAEKLYKGK